MIRPRLLIAEDHAAMRAEIASILASEFEVIAAVGDGQAAVEATELLRPELVVLDLSMPVLSGFDAAVKLGSLRHPPKIVFLTSFDHPSFVEAALKIRVSGFVLKRNMALELRPAIRRALKDPPVEIVNTSAGSGPWSESAPAHVHAVYFYEDAESLSGTVARFIREGLVAGDAAVLIATSSHAASILAELKPFDPQEPMRWEDLLVLDANELLRHFTVDGMPSAQRFEDAIGSILDQASAGGKRGVRAYGEMVDVLWNTRGGEAAAVSLEMLWNRLAARRTFSLLCGYSMDSVGRDAGLRTICDQHSHVVSGRSRLEPRGDFLDRLPR